MNKKRLGSVGAILAGLVAILVLSDGTDAVLETTGVFPSAAVLREQGFGTTWMVALALAYRGVYAAGGYVTAAPAPEHPPLQGNIGTRIPPRRRTLGRTGLIQSASPKISSSDSPAQLRRQQTLLPLRWVSTNPATLSLKRWAETAAGARPSCWEISVVVLGAGSRGHSVRKPGCRPTPRDGGAR